MKYDRCRQKTIIDHPGRGQPKMEAPEASSAARHINGQPQMAAPFYYLPVDRVFMD